MPRDRVLTESDGPFAQLAGDAVKPWQVDIAVRGLGDIWSLSPNDAQNTIEANLRRLLVSHDTTASEPLPEASSESTGVK
jgi:TatD DNase family protein